MLKVLGIISLVFISCGANVVCLEHLVKFSPGCGDLITFSQFLITGIYGFIRVTKFGTVKPAVPLKEYFFAVVLYFASSLSGNLAFSCNISMPIQMIFKSGSVLSSMLLGVLILNKKYSLTKYISVAMITIGIATCLVVSSAGKSSVQPDEIFNNKIQFIFGISLLTLSLFTGARLGICQEQIVKKFGKHPNEMICYIHLLSLPFFAVFANNITKQVGKFLNAESDQIYFLSVGVPVIWIYFVLNIVTQFICISSVTLLTSEISALAITVVLTVRKFLSLIISIVYFQNPFTHYHWMGAALVFSGTLLFSEVPQKLWMLINGDKEDKKKDE